MTIRKLTGLSLLLAAGLLLAACRPTQAPEPTPDADMIRTAAVKTVEAELTLEAERNPTATVTFTPEPTPTSDIPTMMPLAIETQSPAGTGALEQTAATQAPQPGVSTGDKAAWVANTPADGSVLMPGQAFEIKWTVRNTGTTTWNNKYTVRFFSGNIPTGKTVYNFRTETKPDGTTELIVDATAPNAAGDYFTWWKLTNEEGQNFGDVDLSIKVSGSTATPTSAP